MLLPTDSHSGDDKDTILAKTKVLTDASAKMAERMYANQAGDAAGAAEGAAEGAQGAAENTADDDVVDAEFEEVKDDTIILGLPIVKPDGEIPVIEIFLK